ncbi:hypothetical protein HDU79_012060 [Rhizoclosmatium sp. JEL0117]|nr:hypothetical protein HDU79_012060 [Rhizoclosmatium sp. JEL0117]
MNILASSIAAILAVFTLSPLTAPSTRINYSSIANASIVLAFYWNGSNDIHLGAGDNPQVFPYKIGSLANATMGQTYTVPLDLSKVPADYLVTGGKYTIQVVCRQPKFDIYQCADIIYDIAPKTIAAATATAPLVIATAAPASSVAPVTPETKLYSAASTAGLAVLSLFVGAFVL